MTERFIGLDGYPCEFAASPVGQKLISAMKSLDGAESIFNTEITAKARAIYSASEFGKIQELPRNRKATRNKSEDELRKLSKITASLLQHIRNMREPAVSALYRQGWDLFAVERALELWPEGSLRAISELDDDQGHFGAPQKAAADNVTAMVAEYYSQATGRKPTVIKDVYSSEAYGPWLTFLDQVFSALKIKASAESQSKKLFGKKG